MRFALSVLPFLAAFACSTQLAQEAPPEVASAESQLRVGPNDFNDPDCMWDYIDEVRAIEEQYTDTWRQEEAGFRAWYQDARLAGADPQELAEIRAEADRVKEILFDEFYAVLAELEEDVCGDVVDPPCQDPNDPDCCPYVGDDGACYDDYCEAYPDDPNCWDCDLNGDGVCDDCDLAPDQCDPPICDDPNDPSCCPYVGDDGVCYGSYCEAHPSDPDCQVWCDNPDDPDCFCEFEPNHPDCSPDPEPCDPEAGMDCPDPEPCDPEAGMDCPDPEPCDPATGEPCPDPEPCDPATGQDCPDPTCDPATGQNCWP